MSASTFHRDGSAPDADQVFVFGSNLSGWHGGGAAKAAHKLYGAKWEQAEGRAGMSYAIPTVGYRISGPLTLMSIRLYVQRFLEYATEHPETRFLVTRVACGLAGHRDHDVAPMFAAAPANCSLPDAWAAYIGDNT